MREVLNTTSDGSDTLSYPIEFPNVVSCYSAVGSDNRIVHGSFPVMHNCTRFSIDWTGWGGTYDNGLFTPVSQPGHAAITIFLVGR